MKLKKNGVDKMASSSIASLSSYEYKIRLQYKGGEKDREVKTQSIRNVVIDYNYSDNVMPIIMVNMRLEKKFVDDIIAHQNDAYFILTISGHDTVSSYSTDLNAINVKCTYFIPEELNKLDKVEYSADSTDEDNGGLSYTQATLGLICVDHINNNKVQCAITTRDITPQQLIKDMTSHINNMVIENLAYNDTYKSIIIPPNMSDSVNKTLQYLNNQKVFYNTPYRFFQDFNVSYLISSSGNAIRSPVSDMSGNTNGNILIKITEVDDLTTSLSGIISQTINTLLNSFGLGSLGSSLVSAVSSIGSLMDSISNFSLNGSSSAGGTIRVGVNYGNTVIFDNTISNKSQNKLKAMTESGIAEAEYTNRSQLVKSSYHSQRINNNNVNMISNIAFMNNANKYFIYFSKVDLDCTLFTPLKSITINNTDRYQELNGRYLLFRKKESYERINENFVLNSFIFLQRISEGNGNSYSGSRQSSSGCFFSL